MNAKHAVSLLMLVLLVASAFAIQQMPVSISTEAPSNHVLPDASEGQQFTQAAIPQAEDSLNVQNWNWDFEVADANGVPTGWVHDSSAFGETNASYQDSVHSGSYSGFIASKGSSLESWQSYIYQTLPDTPFINEQPILDFYWNAITMSATDLANGAHLRMDVLLTNGSYYYLRYYLVIGSNTLTNSTTAAAFIMNETLSQWNHFQRNLLDDFNAVPGWSAAGNLYIAQLSFLLYSPLNASSLSAAIADDFALTNSTAHDYLQSRNGNFELGTGNFWYTSGNYDVPFISQSSSSVHGSHALNITTSQTRDDSRSYANIMQYLGGYNGFIPTAPKKGIFDFYWNYQDVAGGGFQEAYLQLYFSNDTYWSYLYFLFGTHDDTISFNSTNPSYGYYYISADGFGTRNVWNHFQLDLYSLYQELNFTDIGLMNIRIEAESQGYANASVQLLVDSFRFLMPATGYPGFELERDGRTTSNNIPGWSYDWGAPSSFNHTQDSYSGNWAANITVSSGSSAGMVRYFNFHLDGSSYISFWWRLDDITISSVDYAYLEVILEDYYRVRYYLAADTGSPPSNSSSMVSYYVQDMNTTGVWTHTYRNLTQDVLEGLGSIQLKIINLGAAAFSSAGSRTSLIIDDLTILDVVSPTGTNLGPSATPVYHSPTTITVNADDNRSGVKEVIVSYNTGSTWQNVTGLGTLTQYQASIPAQPWGTTVQYYVIITDHAGVSTILDNGGTYYSFVVGDDVAPTVNWTSPANHSILSNDIVLSAVADDPGAGGSGIARVEFLVDSISIANDTTSPYSVTWDSRSIANGSHTLIARAYDNEGLVSEDSLAVDVQNDVAAPQMYSLMLNPSPPQDGVDTTVTVSVLDDSQVDNVTLFYAIEDSGAAYVTSQTWIEVEMISNGPVYSATIPGQEYGKSILYYVVAYDIYGQATYLGNSSDPYVVDVADINKPSLSIFGPAPESTVSGTVTFSVIAADAASGIDEIRFYVNGTLTSTLQSSEGVIQWDTTQQQNGVVWVHFEVEDRAGNIYNVGFYYIVDNPDALGAISQSLSNIMSAYGFFIGAGAMLGLFIVGKVISRRRAPPTKGKRTKK